MNSHHHQKPNTEMDVSMFAMSLSQPYPPNSASGFVAITYDSAALSTACPRKTSLSHPRKTDRRSVERSRSFLAILARSASASGPPFPPSHSSVVRGWPSAGGEAPVREASSVRRLYRSLSRLTTLAGFNNSSNPTPISPLIPSSMLLTNGSSDVNSPPSPLGIPGADTPDHPTDANASFASAKVDGSNNGCCCLCPVVSSSSSSLPAANIRVVDDGGVTCVINDDAGTVNATAQGMDVDIRATTTTATAMMMMMYANPPIIVCEWKLPRRLALD
mmetsp:Transcript_13601/g.32935  ORF Transcript_13601/g.32935 Transcript_13601/m.32935 type:complete len:275 (-) Transcript_13601:18-842(-)